MSINLTLNNVGNLQDTTTAQATINANNALISSAFLSALSATNQTPPANQMEVDLDMNSNQIINLPYPATLNSPLRLIDLQTFTGGGTIATIPSGGTTGQALVKTSNVNYVTGWQSIPLLTASQTWVAVQTFPPGDFALQGSSTGLTFLSSSNSTTSNYTLTVPAVNDTLATLANSPSITTPLISGGTGAASSLILQSTTGVGTSDFIEFKTGSQTLRGSIGTGPSNTGVWAIGNSLPSQNVQFWINGHANSASTTPAPSGWDFAISGPDAGGGQIMLDGYGSFNQLMFRRADGTAASRTGLVANDIIGLIQTAGWTSAGAYTTANPGCGIQFYATETWTSSHTGCGLNFITIPNGTTSRVTALTIQSSGGISVGSAMDPGLNGLAVSSLQLTGTASGNTTIPIGMLVYPPWYQVTVTGINFNSIGDTAFVVNCPLPNYAVQGVQIYNASASLTNAQWGLFTATGGGGYGIQAAGTAITVAFPGSSAPLGNTYESIAISNPSFYPTSTTGTLYFRVTTAEGSAATGSVSIIIKPLP